MSAQNIPKPWPKESADHSIIEKRKINKDGDMIGTSKRKGVNFKRL